LKILGFSAISLSILAIALP